MICKKELLECSIINFTKFGSKRFTMDELAFELGISKKTIYHHFKTKEDLVIESVSFLVNDFKNEVKNIIESENDFITSIILIYKKGFEHLKYFKPSFIFGLKKYYPKANIIFDEFRDNIVNTTIYGLLMKAKEEGLIKAEVNLKLFCDLYFKRFEEIALKNNNLFEEYTNEELLNHFVIYNLKGIAVSNYKNTYFDQ